MPSADAVITGMLAHLAIGAVVWMLTYSRYATPQAASGLAIIAASIGAIVMWPAIVFVFCQRMIERAQR